MPCKTSVLQPIGPITGFVARIDSQATAQIVTHLLNNAVKYSARSGHISLRVRRSRNSFNIYVADAGVGISTDVLPTLGQPFVQSGQALNNGMKGSGLGLAIATSLAKLQGGSLRIRSRVGKGTVMMVHLPDLAHGAPLPVIQESASEWQTIPDIVLERPNEPLKQIAHL
jgi:two-component system, cell cycle sensor histidine kinase PleC